MKRYQRNIGTITQEEQNLLGKKSVCIIGCGGLGGGVIENLTRMGVGNLTVVDGDVFDETNLNRQVLSHEKNLGAAKALEAAEQMNLINSNVTITPVHGILTEENASDIIRGHDVVVDALDNVGARRCLEQACEAENIPLVHGAIGGWNGQVGIVMPGCRMIQQLYEVESQVAAPTNPPFTPAVVAAMEAAETVELLLNRDEALRNKLLVLDLLNHEYEVIDFD